MRLIAITSAALIIAASARSLTPAPAQNPSATALAAVDDYPMDRAGIFIKGAQWTAVTWVADGGALVVTPDGPRGPNERIAPGALQIARRSRRIALESVLAGMGLSFAAMLVAAAGYLPPVGGALLQEAIDVAVIVNALRALAPGRDEKAKMQTAHEEETYLQLLEREDASGRPAAAAGAAIWAGATESRLAVGSVAPGRRRP